MPKLSKRIPSKPKYPKSEVIDYKLFINQYLKRLEKAKKKQNIKIVK